MSETKTMTKTEILNHLNRTTPIISIIEFLEIYKNNETAQRHLGKYEDLISVEHSAYDWDCYNILYISEGVYYWSKINLFFNPLDNLEPNKKELGGLGHRKYIGSTATIGIKTAIERFKFYSD
jgi:hypothetical protein